MQHLLDEKPLVEHTKVHCGTQPTTPKITNHTDKTTQRNLFLFWHFIFFGKLLSYFCLVAWLTCCGTFFQVLLCGIHWCFSTIIFHPLRKSKLRYCVFSSTHIYFLLSLVSAKRILQVAPICLISHHTHTNTHKLW